MILDTHIFLNLDIEIHQIRQFLTETRLTKVYSVKYECNDLRHLAFGGGL